MRTSVAPPLCAATRTDCFTIPRDNPAGKGATAAAAARAISRGTDAPDATNVIGALFAGAIELLPLVSIDTSRHDLVQRQSRNVYAVFPFGLSNFRPVRRPVQFVPVYYRGAIRFEGERHD
jgi:hypothetical protein